MTRCESCGAADGIAGATCAYCGAALPADVTAPDEARLGPDGTGSGRVEVAEDLPPPREARRFQGLAVPLVAAAIVVGIGYPLTALAVSQVGRLPATSSTPSETGASAPEGSQPGPGRVRLNGAATADGAVTPLGCDAGPPKIVLVRDGPYEYSVLLGVPAAAGTYKLEPFNERFVAVTRLTGGAQTWTSRQKAGASGVVTVGADRSVSARFSGLEPNGGGAEGTVDGTVEARCA